MDITTQSLLQRSNIETNKQFQRLSEKTQVVMPQNGLNEVTKTRLTHSYETATSSMITASNIARQLSCDISCIDYQKALYNTSLLHDIGHPPFGHDGADLIRNYFLDLGLAEGFSDNNNNLVVIEKNNIIVSDYVIASIIKYPEKLYANQKIMYSPILDEAIEQDLAYYKTLGINLAPQSRTIACQIMDEADRNSYVCSDLTDFLCLGNTLSIRDLKFYAKKMNLKYMYSELSTFSNIIMSGSKTSIKAYFNDLKNRFNLNFKLTNNGIEVIDEDLLQYREFLSAIEFEFFIKPIQDTAEHKEYLNKFKRYINDVITNEFYPSKYYEKKIIESVSESEKLSYIRDMVSEITDWYILNYHKSKSRRLGT
jgi:dGTP triphosphohydrolase